MAEETTEAVENGQIFAILTCVHFLSGTHLPDKYFDLVEKIEHDGFVRTRMVDTSNFARLVAEDENYALVSTGAGFVRFTQVIRLTDKGQELIRDSLMG